MPARTGRVHVATTRRTYNGKVYETHLLRRSYRDGEKVKHETLGNISHLPSEVVELIKRSLAGEKFVSADEGFSIERSLPHGHVEAIIGTIGRIGLDTMIYSKRTRQRDLVIAMIVERLLHQSSKLGATRLWHETTLAQELSVGDANEDDLYGALDWLLQRQGQIEKKLAQRHLEEGGLVLYDVSSSYYEGHTCELAQFGYSRDKKKGLPIIVYGVLTDSQGRPVAVDVYKGNTGDPTTVADQVDKLRNRFGLKRVVLVGDRGMLTQTQIDRLKEHPGLGWITALKSSVIKDLVNGGILQPSLFDERDLAEIHSPDYPGERLMACFNPMLADERKRKRVELLDATDKELDRISKEVSRRTNKSLTEAEIGLKVGKVVNRFKMAKHFQITIKEGALEWTRDEQSIQAESQLDGIYVIRTSEQSRQLSAADAVRNYKRLSQVERAFRSMKGIDIRVRPIRHRTNDHVRAHIFLCMLAYYVEWHMRQALSPLLFADEELSQDRESRDPVAPAKPSQSAKTKKASRLTSDGLPLHSFNSLLTALGTRCRNTCVIKSTGADSHFFQLSTPTPVQSKALLLLGL